LLNSEVAPSLDVAVAVKDGRAASPSVIGMVSVMSNGGTRNRWNIERRPQRVGRNRFIAPLRRQSTTRMCPSNVYRRLSSNLIFGAYLGTAQ
jgi:hypothetical protein